MSASDQEPSPGFHRKIPTYSFTLRLFSVRLSKSCTITQWIPLFFSNLLSWICCEENVPFFTSTILTHNSNKLIAIINAVMDNICTIFIIFAATKVT